MPDLPDQEKVDVLQLNFLNWFVPAMEEWVTTNGQDFNDPTLCAAIGPIFILVGAGALTQLSGRDPMESIEATDRFIQEMTKGQ